MLSTGRRWALIVAAVTSIQFLVLTTLAMLLYRGGNHLDPQYRGYSFVHNFFSDLGLTRTYLGESNLVPMILFVVALTGAGLGLLLFFTVFRSLFTRTLLQRILTGAGTAVGWIAGLCFVGVAWFPADRALQWHRDFVIWAFQAFPLAVLCFVLAMLLDPKYPRRYALAFALFLLVLGGYLVLIFSGPAMNTSRGLVAQVVGQKVVVYASVVSVLVQTMGALKQKADV
jgi:hypothetical membrane protein